MESNKKLHLIISSRTIAIVFITISILAVIIFTFASKEIRNEYKRRLDLPGQLIENKVAGYEIINNRDFLKSLIKEDIVQCVIIGTNGKIYYSVTKSLIGRDYWDINELSVINLKNKKENFITRLKNNYKYFTKITELYNDENETLGYLFIKTKKNNFKKEVFQLFSIYIIGSILLLAIVYLSISKLFKKNISEYIDQILNSSKEINQGNLSHTLINFNTGNELDILQNHYNNFVIGLREKTKFAIEIEKKNFDYEFSPLSDRDELGKALTELRNSLKKSTEEELVRKNADEISNWITNGVAKFSEILRKDIDNIEQLGYSVISNLVEYLDANQGGFFLIEEDNITNDKIIELKAAFAFNRKKHYERKISWGEGLIGASIKEKKYTYLTNLPDEYINISSGLGESNPKSLLIVPLSSGDIQYGAIEIASFKEMDEHHIDFVNRISEIIASTISTVKNNERTQQLLRETQEQSEKIKQTEEELRQNIEEMHATQEEVERANDELRQKEEILISQAEELRKEKYLMDALMDNIPDYIFFKDKDGKFLKNSRSHARLFGFEDVHEILGKSEVDYLPDEQVKASNKEDKDIINTGKPIIDHIEQILNKDGSVSWYTTTKMPLRNQEGKIVGTFGVSKDITEIKNLEQETLKSKENLEFENILFTTLMDNITARITFKDSEAKYLRINQTKVKALGIKDQIEVLGKTDRDIFGDSHGAEFIKKEIDNIKKGQSVLNNKELIKYKDGRLSWGSTSRIPLKNKENEIIGGLVITWDVTDQENALLELDMYKDIVQDIFTELSVSFYKISPDKRITNFSGNGIKIMNFKDENDARNKFFKTFPKLFTKLNKVKGYENIEEITEMKINNIKYSIKNIIIPHKMTTQGFTGITVIHKI